MTYTKSTAFDADLQEVSRFAKAMSHPARLAILQHLSRCCICKSGDIAGELPLSRTTVSQHLQELRNLGLIKFEIKGAMVCYEVNTEKLLHYRRAMDNFFNNSLDELTCGCKK